MSASAMLPVPMKPTVPSIFILSLREGGILQAGRATDGSDAKGSLRRASHSTSDRDRTEGQRNRTIREEGRATSRMFRSQRQKFRKAVMRSAFVKSMKKAPTIGTTR